MVKNVNLQAMATCVSAYVKRHGIDPRTLDLDKDGRIDNFEYAMYYMKHLDVRRACFRSVGLHNPISTTSSTHAGEATAHKNFSLLHNIATYVKRKISTIGRQRYLRALFMLETLRTEIWKLGLGAKAASALYKEISRLRQILLSDVDLKSLTQRGDLVSFGVRARPESFGEKLTRLCQQSRICRQRTAKWAYKPYKQGRKLPKHVGLMSIKRQYGSNIKARLRRLRPKRLSRRKKIRLVHRLLNQIAGKKRSFLYLREYVRKSKHPNRQIRLATQDAYYSKLSSRLGREVRQVWNLKPEGAGAEYSAYQAMNRKRGGCTEYAYIMRLLCVIAGIPGNRVMLYDITKPLARRRRARIWHVSTAIRLNSGKLHIVDPAMLTYRHKWRPGKAHGFSGYMATYLDSIGVAISEKAKKTSNKRLYHDAYLASLWAVKLLPSQKIVSNLINRIHDAAGKGYAVATLTELQGIVSLISNYRWGQKMIRRRIRPLKSVLTAITQKTRSGVRPRRR